MDSESLRQLIDGLLASQLTATARAYAGDIRHLETWLAERRHPGLAFVDATDVYRYLRHLVAAQRAPSTVRRRMTAYKALKEYCRHQGYLWDVDLAATEALLRAALTVDPEAAVGPLLVSSEDRLFMEGVRASFAKAGIADVVAVPHGADGLSPGALASCDYALVHVGPGPGLDKFRVIERISRLSQARAARQIVVVVNVKLHPLVRLRMAEAGVAFVYPYAAVAAQPELLAHGIVEGALDERFRLDGQWAMRQDLGLRWDGLLQPFLEAAVKLPPELWISGRAQADLPASRAQLREIQRSARDVAGLPEPDFRKYAASLRRPPELPEWHRVRAFVRALLGRASATPSTR